MANSVETPFCSQKSDFTLPHPPALTVSSVSAREIENGTDQQRDSGSEGAN